MVRYACCAAVAGAVLAATVLTGCMTTPKQEATAAPVFGEAFVAIGAEAQNAAMQRGVNVLGYDPVWEDPAKGRFTPAHFKRIHDAGFNNVRIVLQSFKYIDDEGTLDPQWFATLDRMVKAALATGLVVILDEHDYHLCGKDIKTCRFKLNAFWGQIAPRYKDAPNRLIFELLNEPHEAMTPALWNTQLRETLAIIRATNPQRNVIIGPGYWNGLEELPSLDLPKDDRHIIATFHYYHPMEFTHQGAAWTPDYKTLGVPWGSEADFALLNKELDTVKAWAEAHQRPIFLGEFGAYDKAAMEYRVKWDAAVARAAEARGFSWAYWQFDPDFVLWDFKTGSWVEPILNALIPPAQVSSGGTEKPLSSAAM